MGDLWLYLAAMAGVAAALGFVATRRQQALVRKWDALLTPAGRQALGRLELQTISDGSMADYSLDAAQRARRRDDLMESTRLLQLAYSVIEDATPDRLRRLRAISVCIRMASAVVPVRQESVMALALREAVTNIVRHARATTCRVALRIERGDLILTVHDNGIGGLAAEGHGLAGMRERVAALGGSVTVDSSKGTLLTVRLPALSNSTETAT